jgi:hypothetical protein
MDDNDVKLAASAHKSDGNVTPGIIHVAGVNARSNDPRPDGLDKLAAGGKSDIGALPNDWNHNDTNTITEDALCKKISNNQGLQGNSLQGNSRLNDDLEFGEFLVNANEDGITVALPVNTGNDEFTPNAVEYDTDTKPVTIQTKCRFGVYIFLALSILVVAIVGATIGLVLTNSSSQPTDPSHVQPPNQTYHSALRQYVQQIVSQDELDDLKSPYRMALDWISTKDKMSMTPENPRFGQRYLLAYIYYATSVKQPWESNCAPSNDTDNFNCIYKMKTFDDKEAQRSAIKWLSNTNECTWAGIHCDLKSQVDQIELGTTYKVFMITKLMFQHAQYN